MSAFSGKQRPWTADAGSVEGGAVFMFAVAVAVVTVPAGSLRQFDREERVNGAQRVQNARIIGRAQAKAHQRQRVGADDVIGALAILTRWTVLDGNEPLRGRSSVIRLGRGNAHVVALDTKLLRQVPARRVDPALDVVVPRVRCIAHDARLFAVPREVCDVSS